MPGRDGLRDKRSRFENFAVRKRLGFKQVLGMVTIVALIVFWMIGKENSPDRERSTVAKPVTYRKIIKMEEIQTKEENGSLVFKLSEVKKNRIVNFMYEGTRVADGTSTKPLSLMSYIMPSGKLFVGTAYCPPCRSDKHFIDKDGTLTCDLCGTKRNLETLEGIEGGCIDYPPDEFNAGIRNGMVEIGLRDLKAWSPKPL